MRKRWLVAGGAVALCLGLAYPTGIRLELRSARPAGLQLQAASGLLPPATQRNWVAARLGVTLRDR